jgi:hypothetical protein
VGFRGPKSKANGLQGDELLIFSDGVMREQDQGQVDRRQGRKASLSAAASWFGFVFGIMYTSAVARQSRISLL